MADGERGYITRGVVFALDPTPAQERLLGSYCGAARFAYNWAVSQIMQNLVLRAAEREAGVKELDLTPAVPWSEYSLRKSWNQAKDEVAPWWQEVSMHAFRSGLVGAASALKGFSDSKNGDRTGRRVGFPRYKKKGRCTQSVSFVELNHQLSWLHPSRHGIRLMLPQSSPDPGVRRRRAQLEWLHTTTSTRRLHNLVQEGRGSIQKVTIAKRGGRWQAAFSVRYYERPAAAPGKRLGDVVGVDAGVKHLATLSFPVPGVSDELGHVTNPEVLAAQLRRLKRLDRAIARCEKGSRNRAKLAARRALLHGRVTKTRALHLHALSKALSGSFETVVLEDLNVAGMTRSNRTLARRLHDTGLFELRRQLTYKCEARTANLVVVDRFFASSKTCSSCGVVKATLPRFERVFHCEACGLVLDRDRNAAVNLEQEGKRILLLEKGEAAVAGGQACKCNTVAGLRPETLNADPRVQKTPEAHARVAALA